MRTLPNVVKFRLAGFPLDALDQKRMRRLRRTSDRTGVPIPDLISEIVGQVVETWLAETELPNKIVKFPAAGRQVVAFFAVQIPVEGHKNIIDPFQKLIVSPKRFICAHG
jgi:hypothetical protein